MLSEETTLQPEQLPALLEKALPMLEGVTLLQRSPPPRRRSEIQATTGLLVGAVVMPAGNGTAKPDKHGPRPPMRFLRRGD